MSDPELTPEPTAEAKVQLGFAHGWARKRRLDLAATHLHRALAISPGLEGAWVELAKIHRAHQRWGEVIDTCEEGLARFSNQARLHKYLIEALRAERGPGAAFARYGLESVNAGPFGDSSREVFACVVVRNEVDRLPWFLDRARQLGVDRFFVVDNGSTDGSAQLLARQPDVHLWHTDMSFNAGNFGSAWFEVLMAEHGVGRWLLMLDVDEAIRFPGDDRRLLGDFCADLERAGASAASAVHLDMYGESAIGETWCEPGIDPLTACPYFDAETIHESLPDSGPFKNQIFHWGGMRKRVFGDEVGYLLSKVPLVRYGRSVVLAGGQHWTSHPAGRIAHDACAVLHFKYVAGFVNAAQREADRQEHADGGLQYRSYAKVLADDPEVRPYDPAHSIRFTGTEQLIERGLVDASGLELSPDAPAIAPRPAISGDGPFWSVMITVYDRLHLLERSVRSVTEQAADDMQIEVVCDRTDDATVAEVRRIVAAADPHSVVEVTALTESAGHPHIFNEAIARARGEWVHILHDDDWVRPGFYTTLAADLASRPELGAAFPHHELSSSGDPAHEPWSSPVERETPGVIDGWFERLSAVCRVQFSAMVVRRSTYEQLGGFRPGIGSAFDWEMWLRIAAVHPVWFEPTPLVMVTRDGSAESDRLVTDGSQIDDAMRVLTLAAASFPADRRRHLVGEARERYALLGVDLARDQLKRGDRERALDNIRAALDASSSDAVVDAVSRLLGRAAL